jgi:predicted DCC family thiol-disulfide oxidoreductase YuxK
MSDHKSRAHLLDNIEDVQQSRRTLVYDGECGFCTTSANWIVRRWPDEGGPMAVPWQRLSDDAMQEMHLSLDDVQKAAWFVEGNRSDGGSRAIGRALGAAGGTWAVIGWSLLNPPISWVAPLGYRLVARYRDRLPGGTPACKA